MPRKLLLLLYVVTENTGDTGDPYRELDESYITLEERLEDHWWTLNAMLSDCGMAPLDLRKPLRLADSVRHLRRRKRVHERPDGAGVGPFISGEQKPCKAHKETGAPMGEIPKEARLFWRFSMVLFCGGLGGVPCNGAIPFRLHLAAHCFHKALVPQGPWTRSPASTRTVPWFSKVPAKRVPAPRESSPSFWSVPASVKESPSW